jgi:hypothetical protein
VERARKRIARRSPREASRSGRDRRQGDGARNTRSFGRFTSPASQKRPGFEQRPSTPAGACSPRSANHCAERCFGHRPALPSHDGARVLHDSRGNTFRFVVCSSSIQSAMALQLPASNLRWQPHEEQFGRKVGSQRAVAKAELDQGGASRHDARPAGSSSQCEQSWWGSIEVVWRRARPNKAGQVTWFVLSPVCSARGRLSRVTHPLPQGSAERARHARRSAKGLKPVSARVPRPWRAVLAPARRGGYRGGHLFEE